MIQTDYIKDKIKRASRWTNKFSLSERVCTDCVWRLIHNLVEETVKYQIADEMPYIIYQSKKKRK